jgi:ornithine cyclodeaminase/alanine dehydrogenase-like protein (mu-crystallin family)
VTPHVPLYLPEERIAELLDLQQLIPALEQALIDFSSGRVVQPLRSVIRVEEHAGWFGLMPAVYGDVFGAKLVTVFPNNAARGLHTHHALIQLFRAETGEPLAILDGRFITAWRTAAVSSIATRELSNPDARVLAILGSGVQARTHFHALKTVRSFSEVRVWSPTEEHARRFASEIGASYMSAEQAVRGADVIVTATAAVEPILRGAWVKPGAYVNAVGAIGPVARELDDELMRSAAVVVESRESARHESAEIAQSGVAVYAELGELVAGTLRKPTAPVTVYKSLGIAIEDVVAARLVYRAAVETTSKGPVTE